jgi:hypothetical protein
VLVTSISSKKSKKTKEPKSRERECDENEWMGEEPPLNPLLFIGNRAGHWDMGRWQWLGAVWGSGTHGTVGLGHPTCGVGRPHLESVRLQLFAVALEWLLGVLPKCLSLNFPQSGSKNFSRVFQAQFLSKFLFKRETG